MARTDRDRWDLATSVGATATMVAAQRGMACRTRFYDHFFLEATKSGIGQVVILASGLDARAYRLPWPADTVVYEVDMPEVIEFKTVTLSELGAEPTAERRTVAIDLRDDWATALRAAGFDPLAPAAWSAGGLLVYLPDAAQDALFDNITALSAPGSRLAFEFVPDTHVFADERWRAHHDRMSELGFDIDFNDLVYHSQRGHTLDYLNQRGWRTSSQTVKELHAANGFVYPDDEVAEAFADVTYTSAVLTS